MDTTTIPKPPSGGQNDSKILNEDGIAARERDVLPAAGQLSRLQREVEAGFEAALRRTEIRLRSTYEHCKSEVREFPAQSVLIAAAGGYICHRLPIRSILATGVFMAVAAIVVFLTRHVVPLGDV